MQVVVAEGAVSLRSIATRGTRDSVILVAGQLGQVFNDGRLDSVHAVDPDDYLAWTRGELVFENTPLASVAEELSRWYDVDVQVADSTHAGPRFSGRLDHRSFEDALQLVATVTDASVRRVGRSWIFHGRRSP